MENAFCACVLIWLNLTECVMYSVLCNVSIILCTSIIIMIDVTDSCEQDFCVVYIQLYIVKDSRN